MTAMRTNIMPVLAAVLLLVTLCLVPGVAFATNMEQLNAAYVEALRGYENALDEQDANSAEIEATQQKIQETEQQCAQAQKELGETAVTLYKGTRSQNVLVNIILGSESFQDAVIRYDLYRKVEDRCAERIRELAAQRDELVVQKVGLEAQKVQLQSKVDQALKEAQAAEEAILKASHVDGDEYHQVQGNDVNCGATAFIVGVNILRHENLYTNNVKVWKGDGFEGDSTSDLAARGAKWLEANDLDQEIGIEEVKGDIHKASELQELLEDGNVVVISSGSGSEWRFADDPDEGVHTYGDGHWVVFYYYEAPDAETGDLEIGDADEGEGEDEDADDDDESQGVFYCNDSGVSEKRGAGVPYTEEQMQDWLDGRENHFATVLYTK